MHDLPTCRRFFAEELRAVAHLRSEALVRSFATVHREAFLGQGPWQILVAYDAGVATYRTTEDADPRHVYHNVLVGIDPARCLNNGQPSSLAGWFEHLDLNDGDDVVHVGCGTGYYTAILAELVGPQGRIIAYEIDHDLAERARANLRSWPNVEVFASDGGHAVATADALFINAGTTHPHGPWLESIKPGGRLLVPMTVSKDGFNTGVGKFLKVVRKLNGLAAEFVSDVGIFPCVGNRDRTLNDMLDRAFQDDSWKSVRSVRLDAHEPSSNCWLHTHEACLSCVPLPEPRAA